MAIDVQRDILREHGVHLPYKQASLGKEVARVILHGSEVSSYDLLLWYANMVVETNLGRIVIVDKEGEHFIRAFFSFQLCILGFNRGCRPLLFNDSTHLLGNYGGTLFGTTSKDGNNGFFHVAFGIDDNEIDVN